LYTQSRIPMKEIPRKIAELTKLLEIGERASAFSKDPFFIAAIRTRGGGHVSRFCRICSIFLIHRT